MNNFRKLMTKLVCLYRKFNKINLIFKSINKIFNKVKTIFNKANKIFRTVNKYNNLNQNKIIQMTKKLKNFFIIKKIIKILYNKMLIKIINHKIDI